ncbi:preprotein translocase subunit SecY [Patescibacteria group bacterium]|nr:preprotein translocase subunit SecY [Patescibacteria group bacterium]
MLKYLKQIWNSKTLRKKILFTLFAIIIYRLAAHVSIPNINLENVKEMFNSNQLLGVYNLLTGGSAYRFSIIMMGLAPYINASIIMQLLTVVVPKLEALSKEGEHGKKMINKYTRYLTIPIAIMQSYGMILILNSSSDPTKRIIENAGELTVLIPIMLTVTAGTLFLVWLGELMTEKGIGNGVSLLITASILSGIPTSIGGALSIAGGTNDTKMLYAYVGIIIITILLTIFIILITEAQRQIPITYAGRGIKARSENSSLPIKINQAGMIPIIFAVSVLSFPQLLSRIISSENKFISDILSYFSSSFNSGSVAYLITYLLLVLGFTYFYVSITFNPKQVAENIQKKGGFIPGIRPGKQTAEFLQSVSSKLTLFGGLFLGFVAVFPLLIQFIFKNQLNLGGDIPLLISGAGMIIIVGVVLELFRQINAQLIMHDYDKLY